MATDPEAWHEGGPVNSQHNEFWAQGKVGATISHSSSLQHKKAPRAEPEDDTDVLGPDKTLQEDQMLTRDKLAGETKLESQECCLCIPRETQDIEPELEQAPKKFFEALKPLDESKKSVAQSGDAFLPSHPLSDITAEDAFEKEGTSSLEAEVAEWMSDAEIISDPTEDITSPESQNSQEWPQTLLTEPVDVMLDSPAEQKTEGIMRAEETHTQLHILSDAFSTSQPESNTSGAAHYSCSDSNSSDNVCFPPFADESAEEEELNMDIASCQQQWASVDVRNRFSQPSHCANISVFTDQDTLTVPAVPEVRQQEELLIQSHWELTPRGVNQEAAQQVYSQRSPPLSAVSIEVSNQGGTASQGCGCVVAVRERDSRAGESTEGESEQTDEEEGQKKSVHERNTATGQKHDEGLLSYSKTVQIQELKAERYTCSVPCKPHRMESDSCDDSQSDSGVSADFSPGSTLEGNSTVSTGTATSTPKETPIEREIRRAIEREHSLRRSRGLPNPPTCPEYVDVPLRKTVLCHSFTAKSEKYEGKDRHFAGKKMQHEILREAQREQDLVKLGKVPGFYDKGTVRQLKDRKQIFEAFLKPSDSNLSVSTRTHVTSWTSPSDISTSGNQEDISSQTSTIGASNGEIRQSIDLVGPTQNHNLVKGGGPTNVAPRGPGFSEATGCQVIILENTLSVPALKLHHNKQKAEPVTAVDSGSSGTRGREQEKEEEDKMEEAAKENPFFKLRSSTSLVKVEQDIREAQEREKELHKQRMSLYGSTGGAGGKGRTLPPSSLNGRADSRQSSSRPAGTEAGECSEWVHSISQALCLYERILVCNFYIFGKMMKTP